MRRPHQAAVASDLQQMLTYCKRGGLTQLDAMADELCQAKALLATSIGSLRCDIEDIAQRFDHVADAQSRERIAHAVVALQSEDALTQILDHILTRAAMLSDLLERVEPLTSLIAREVVFNRDAAGLAWISGQLGEISDGLHKMKSMQTPVANRSPASGGVEIF